MMARRKKELSQLTLRFSSERRYHPGGSTGRGDQAKASPASRVTQRVTNVTKPAKDSDLNFLFTVYY